MTQDPNADGHQNGSDPPDPAQTGAPVDDLDVDVDYAALEAYSSLEEPPTHVWSAAIAHALAADPEASGPYADLVPAPPEVVDPDRDVGADEETITPAADGDHDGQPVHPAADAWDDRAAEPGHDTGDGWADPGTDPGLDPGTDEGTDVGMDA